MTRHISEQFDAELDAIQLKLLEMGGLAESQVKNATTAFVAHNGDLAGEVRSNDRSVNALELAIDEDCTHIIARRQPTASDLRRVIAIMKAGTDLERVGDEAKRIAKSAQAIEGYERPDHEYAEIRRLSTLVSTMLTKSLDAFARTDVDDAYSIIDLDDEIDSLHQDVIDRTRANLETGETPAREALAHIMVARALERIGDHAKNICEYLVYVAKGEDVRHAPRSP